MDRSKTRRIKKELQQLVEQKRKRDLLERPCPECGYIPARIIPMDQDTGLDIHTGKPPCSRCRGIQDRYRPDAYNVIELIMPDRNPDGPDDGPAAAAA